VPGACQRIGAGPDNTIMVYLGLTFCQAGLFVFRCLGLGGIAAAN